MINEQLSEGSYDKNNQEMFGSITTTRVEEIWRKDK